jgi:RNA polymerase sigma-70 factor (ECF subfamily)
MHDQMIDGCLKNDRTWQKRLYDVYSAQMYSICLRYCGQEASAADALQNAFIKVFQNLASYRNEGDLGAWIRRIVVHACLDQIKLDKRSVLQIHTDDLQIGSLDAYELHENMTFEVLVQLLNEMPPGYKTVFSMAVLDDMNHKEIAECLNITEATSRSQLLKARKFMQHLLSKKSMLYV